MTNDIEFDYIKKQKREYFKKYCENHREDFNWYSKKYRANNPEKVRLTKQNWYFKNREMILKKQAIYRKKKKIEREQLKDEL